MSQLDAPHLTLQPVSVTRKMAASLPGLRDLAQSKGLKMHHLGAGYPHPEVTDPRSFIEHERAYVDSLIQAEGINDSEQVAEVLRESFSYTDTLGPITTRQAFAKVYGADWNVQIDPQKLIPTVGATGGINLLCSIFEHPGTKVAYITDAPTYAGFTARVGLCAHANIFSVEMDDEGPIIERLRAQIYAAREQGYFVPFYYTVPDGHNPAGFSFSQKRREEIVAVAQQEGFLIVEDAPYVYINFAAAEQRAKPFLSVAPEQTVHLFTGSKIGFPGPRVGFVYSEANLNIADGAAVSLAELALTESSSNVLFQNPQALRGFEALLHESVLEETQEQDRSSGGQANFILRKSLWPIAEQKLTVYRENREILLSTFDQMLGQHKDYFSWTIPQAGFFSVFTFLSDQFKTDDGFVEKLVSDYGVVVIPMYDFYPHDARQRDANVGLNQLRISFCFSESTGEARRQDMQEAATAFCHAVLKEAGLS